MKELIDFLSKPTMVGIAALAILGVVFVLKEIVAFFQNNIFPQFIRWRLERREIIIPFADKVLDRDWKEPTFFRAGTPKFVDFEQGFVLIRPEVELIESKLKKHRFVYIEGLPSSGKSIIALTIAYKKIKEKYTVVYFNRPTNIPETFIANILTSLYSELDKRKVLIIVDDVHLDIASASKMFAPIYSNFENANLLFISRPLSVYHNDNLEEWQYRFTDYMDKVEISADSAILDLPSFYTRKKYKKTISPYEQKLFVSECGNDVLLLGRYLSEWDGASPVNLDTIKKGVFRKVQDDLELMRQSAPDAIKALLVLGVFYKFEIPVEEDFFNFLNLDTSYLSQTSEVKIENGFVRLYHSSLAKLYSNVIRSIQMPEYKEFAEKLSPFPSQLFKEYVRSMPRNVPELLLGLRFAPDMMKTILQDQTLTESIRTCFEHEQNLPVLGWSLVIMKAIDGISTWRILEKADFEYHARNIADTEDAIEVTVFLLNLTKISEVKLREWIRGIPAKRMTELLERVNLKIFALTLKRIRRTDKEYFDNLLEILHPNVICEKFLSEQNIDNLRLSLRIMLELFNGFASVKSDIRTDFTGERTTRISFFVKNKRVFKTMPGHLLEIPHTHSRLAHERYVKWLWESRIKKAWITIDNGAAEAIHERRTSLFPAGVTSVFGSFLVGDIVEIRDDSGNAIAAGVVNFSNLDLDKIKGMRTEQILRSYTKLYPNRVIDNDLMVLKRKLERKAIA
jgi:predicted ribosome-associated RNA-binding protein Tma20